MHNSGPDRGQSPVEWVEIPYVHPSVPPPQCQPARPLGQLVRPQGQLARSQGQLARPQGQQARSQG